MTKDIIYIDVEDDITSIIGKIKSSREKIVALVPPKRTGVLQSAVNLRLLVKKSADFDKKIVIITNNHALVALSAAAKIPVAKNLQAKPELSIKKAEAEAEEDADVIDGAQLPIGDHIANAKQDGSDSIDEEDDLEVDVKNKDDSIDSKELVIEAMENEEAEKVLDKKDKTKKVKVPDFSHFRKYIFFGGFALVILIGFLVWANIYAPFAKIIVTAKTTPAPISMTLKLADTTDVSTNTVQTVSQQIKKDVKVDFDATGTDTVGDKASGTMTLSNSDSSDDISVPAGSVFSNGDYDFVTTTDSVVPGAGVVGGQIVAGSVDVKIQAVDIGTDYNLSARAYTSSIEGIAAYGGQMSGGSSRDIKVVTESDIQKASEKLVAVSNEEAKSELMSLFKNEEVVIKDSFVANRQAAVSSPEVGKEATGGKATLTSSTTFSIVAIAKSEIDQYLDSAINKQISDNQKVYDNGFSGATLSSYLKTDQSTTVNLASVGKVGPNIDQDKIKDLVKGKRFGDVQSTLSIIKGVNDVEVKFSYFWVTTIPDDNKKIEIEFVLEDA